MSEVRLVDFVTIINGTNNISDNTMIGSSENQTYASYIRRYISWRKTVSEKKKKTYCAAVFCYCTIVFRLLYDIILIVLNLSHYPQTRQNINIIMAVFLHHLCIHKLDQLLYRF